jgi:signal transduction histidine kinase
MGILGHDLRNPLGAVCALAALLLKREDLAENVRENLSEIGHAGQRMLEMIGTLLDFTTSRFTGELPIAPVATDLHEVCRSVVDELLAAAPDRTIELHLEGDGSGVWDPARMAQVISNLASNALEHGSRQGPVRVSIRGDDGDAVLEVENQGPPIPPELRTVMFEPFCRGSALRDASHARGLGLGLYIVNQVVTAHGGSIAVDSSEENGTTFTVRLPRVTPGHLAQPLGTEWDGAAAGA